MWESSFRVREYMPDEKCALMNVAGYIDRNPVKAKMAQWPDKYEWWTRRSPCRGVERVCLLERERAAALAEEPYRSVLNAPDESIATSLHAPGSTVAAPVVPVGLKVSLTSAVALASNSSGSFA